MGTMLSGLEDHEGYAAIRLPDGTLTGSYNASTVVAGYVASCECATGYGTWKEWRGATVHPPTEEGEQAALDEWERDHARPLLEVRKVEDAAAAERHTEALRTAGLIDPYSDGPNVEAIVGTWWHPDGPYSGDRIAAAAHAVDELLHYLARATAPWADTRLGGPDLYRVLGQLRSGLGRLDQMLDQMSGHAAELADDPTLYDDRRGGHSAGHTAEEVQGALDAARVALGPLTKAIAAGHSASSHLGHDTTASG